MFYDNLRRICEERKTTVSAACRAIGKSPNRGTGWKQSSTLPTQEEMQGMADYLGCTVADFFSDEPWAGEGPSTSHGEEQLLWYYRACSTEQKRELLEAVSRWAWEHFSSDQVEAKLI